MTSRNEANSTRSNAVSAVYFTGLINALELIDLPAWLEELVTQHGSRFESLIEQFGGWKNQFQSPVSLLASYDQGGHFRYFELPALDKPVVYPTLTSPQPLDLAPYRSPAQAELNQFLQQAGSTPDPGFTLRAARYLSQRYLTYVGLELGDEIYPLHDVLQALAAIVSATPDPTGEQKVCLATLDMSGIQDFVYNISSSKALRSLRGRSLFIELVSQLVIREVLEAANCTEDSQLTRSGGYYALLLPVQADFSALHAIVKRWNERLLTWQEGRIFLAFATGEENPLIVKDLVKEIKTGTEPYPTASKKVTEALSTAKQRKFHNVLKRAMLEATSPGEACRMCRRHVERYKLKQIDEQPTCDLCRFCLALGKIVSDRNSKELALEYNSQYRGWQLNKDDRHILRFEEAPENQSWSHTVALNPRGISALEKVDFVLRTPFSPEIVFSEIEQETELSSQVKPVDESKLQTDLSRLAEVARGWKGLGVIQADVDSLGQLLRGNTKKLPLISLISTSRLLTLFFTDYIVSLVQGQGFGKQYRLLEQEPAAPRRFQTIYGGGDDFFGVGTWNDTLELAVDLGRCWKQYVGYNPKATLSVGISLHDPKFPVQTMARISHDALEKAKDHRYPPDAKGNEVKHKKDSIYATFARRPLFWGDFDAEMNQVAPPASTLSSHAFERLVKPLARLLPNELKAETEEKMARAFLRRLLDADTATHPKLKDAEDERFTVDPRGQVDMLYLLTSTPERKRLEQREQPDPNWILVRDYLKEVHNTRQPPDLSFYLQWLDLLVRQPDKTKNQNNKDIVQ